LRRKLIGPAIWLFGKKGTGRDENGRLFVCRRSFRFRRLSDAVVRRARRRGASGGLAGGLPQ